MKPKQRKTKLEWFSTASVPASPAELIISKILDQLKVSYVREVSFHNFTSEKGHHYRYDFYLPKYNIILEYDGKQYHKNKTNDNIKNIFCKRNNIKIVRYCAKHYYNLDKYIKKLLK